MKGYYSYEEARLDKRAEYVNNSIYIVYAVEGVMTCTYWEVRAGSSELALEYVENHPERYEIRLSEHLEVAPKYFPETVHLPFQF